MVEKPKSAMREVQADGPNSRLFGREEIEPKAPLGGSSPVQIGPLWPDLLLVIERWLARSVRWVLEVTLGCAAFIIFFCVLPLIVHLISGDTSPRGVLVDGLRFFGVALTIATVVFFVGRWLYWFADRWIQKG